MSRISVLPERDIHCRAVARNDKANRPIGTLRVFTRRLDTPSPQARRFSFGLERHRDSRDRHIRHSLILVGIFDHAAGHALTGLYVRRQYQPNLLVRRSDGRLHQSLGLHVLHLLFVLGYLPRGVEMFNYLVISKLPDLLRSTATLFFACRAWDGFIVLHADVPLVAAIDAGPRTMRQLMSADLLAGFVEGLDELTGEVGTLVVGV